MPTGSTSTRSFTDTMAATWLHTGCACGASGQEVGRLPHSSASTCENAIYRKRSTGSTFSICSRTRRNSFFGPVWNSSGFSSTTQVLVEREAAGEHLGRHGDADAVGVGRDADDGGTRGVHGDYLRFGRGDDGAAGSGPATASNRCMMGAPRRGAGQAGARARGGARIRNAAATPTGRPSRASSAMRAMPGQDLPRTAR